MDMTPEPDLHPLYPSTAHVAVQLSSHSGLAPPQMAELVQHCLTRACLFADLALLQYLLSDGAAQAYIDLGQKDDDGAGLVIATIHGFGGDSDRDLDREEVVRLLVAQGADLSADAGGWTPLHHAALLSPPTLVSYLMTHGCSSFATTHKGLTALDIVTGHSTLPGRDDVALLMEELMRSEGWTGGRVEAKRREQERIMKRQGKRREVRNDVGRVLELQPKWWGREHESASMDSDDDEEDEYEDNLFTPPSDYASMLVFAPTALPDIFASLITNYEPSFRDATPANTLYMLARFACLTCDHNWLEEVILGATDVIEETFFNNGDDIECLVFWLYNTTVWLHLLQCDESMREACEMLGVFEILEDVINSVFVFIIRYAERKTDQLLDPALLDHSSLGPEFDSVQFESSWSFLRPFSGKSGNKTPTPTISRAQTHVSSPSTASSVSSFQSPDPGSTSPSKAGAFSSIKQSLARSRAQSSATSTPLQSVFAEQQQQQPNVNGPTPRDIVSFLTALHTMLVLSDINPAFVTQLWSQVMYWTACEVFNRILTRKKYLCRSKAVQISANIGAIEEWVTAMGLPKGVQNHFAPVRDLLSWLQCLSSITEFPDLIATVQKMKALNPLQMRRAVRDYKYEVNEGRMTEECIQYLTQLQKDWERHRVKMGVEALRKEMTDRERDRDDAASFNTDTPSISSASIASSANGMQSAESIQQSIDILFEAGGAPSWEPSAPPQVLGELLDSRHMLPLLFPSDPRNLSVLPYKRPDVDGESGAVGRTTPSSRASSRLDHAAAPPLRSRNRKLREVGVGTLKWVDGVAAASRWSRPAPAEHDEDNTDSEDEERGDAFGEGEDGESEDADQTMTLERNVSHKTPLTAKRSVRKSRLPSADESQATVLDDSSERFA